MRKRKPGETVQREKAWEEPDPKLLEGLDVEGLTEPWMKPFIAQVRQNATLTHAAASIGRTNSFVHKWKRKDENFRRAYESARQVIVQKLEQSAMDRATNGWLEPVFHKGEVVGHIRKYSNALTIFMLKCWDPDRYHLERSEGGNIEEKAYEVNKAIEFIRRSGGPTNGSGPAD